MAELLQVLTKFHREVLLPDVERIVEGAERRLRDEMHGGFDALAQRLDRLGLQEQMRILEARIGE